MATTNNGIEIGQIAEFAPYGNFEDGIEGLFVVSDIKKTMADLGGIMYVLTDGKKNFTAFADEVRPARL